MSSSRCLTSCGSRSMSVTSASTSCGSRVSASRRTDGARSASGWHVVGHQRLHAADQAVGPAEQRRPRWSSVRPTAVIALVRACPASRDAGDRLVGLGAGLGRRPRWPRRPWRGSCHARDGVVRLRLGGATPAIASSALARVSATPAMASSALARVSATPAIASSARSTTPSTRVSSPSTRDEQLLHAADGRAHPGDQGERVGDAVAHAVHRGEDVGRPGTEGSLTRPTLRTGRVASLFGCARRARLPRVGVADRSAPVSWRIPRACAAAGSSPVEAGTTARRGLGRREGVDTGGGTAEVGRRGDPRRPRAHPPVARRRPPGAEPVTVEQLLARQGSATGRRRAARRVEEPVEPRRSGPRSRAGSARRRSRPCPGALRPPVPAPQAGLPPVARRRPRRVTPAAGAAARPRPRAERRRCGSRTVRPSRRSGPDPAPARALPAAAARPPRRPGRARPRAPRAAARPAPAGAGWAASLLALGRRRRRRRALPPGPLLLRRPEDRPRRGAGHRRAGGAGAGPAGGRRDLPRRRHGRARSGRRVVGDHPARLGVAPTATARCWSASRRRPWSTPRSAAPWTGRCGTRPPRRSRRRCSRAAPPAWCGRSSSSPACAIDHYLGVDLARLPGMVDALGGVPVCITPSEATVGGGHPAARPARPSCPARRPPGTCSRATPGPTSPGPPSPSGRSAC